MATLADWIKDRRAKLKITQRKLSILSGVTEQTISQLENGYGGIHPNLKTVRALSDHLGPIGIKIRNGKIEAQYR